MAFTSSQLSNLRWIEAVGLCAIIFFRRYPDATWVQPKTRVYRDSTTPTLASAQDNPTVTLEVSLALIEWRI